MATVLKTVEMQADSERGLQISVKGDIFLSFSVSCFYLCPDRVFMSVYGLHVLCSISLASVRQLLSMKLQPSSICLHMF